MNYDGTILECTCTPCGEQGGHVDDEDEYCGNMTKHFLWSGDKILMEEHEIASLFLNGARTQNCALQIMLKLYII